MIAASSTANQPEAALRAADWQRSLADAISDPRELLTELGLPFHTIVAPGMSEDVGMLLAYEAGATLIVAVGTHATMVEFLDKGRRGMASTFLTRLRLGPVLVDAKGVSRLYNPGLSLASMGLFAAAFAMLMVIVVVTTPALGDFFDLLWLKIKILLGL